MLSPYSHGRAVITTVLLSLPLSVISAACLNDQEYTYDDDGKSRPCSNIRIKETRRQTLCLLDEVRENCPQSCGICCEDDPDFTFPLNNIFGTSQDCAWITKNNIDIRRGNYCGMEDTVGTTSIRNMCPLACDL